MVIQVYNKQMDTMRKVVEQGFINEMSAHVKQFFPDYCSKFEGGGLQAYCENTIEKAASFGYETERDIFLFLNVMVLLGPNFDSDPSLEWAQEILKNEIAEPEYNLEELADAASRWVNLLNKA